MEDHRHGVRLIGMKPTRSLVRFIERQVQKWIEREQSLLFLPNCSNFRVTIEREEERLYYHCALEISIGSRRWSSAESARTLHDALARALRHLKQTTPSESQSIPLPATAAESHRVA